MAAPVAIQLAGARELVNAGGAPRSPTSPVSPTSPPGGGFSTRTPSPYATLNVREAFETYGLDQTKEISKRVNLEIEKKREELRTLVGERYRDLIDAADTIGLMSTSSSMIFQKLGSLRQKMSTLPTQLNAASKISGGTQNGMNEIDTALSKDELEVAFELKLSLEAERVVQKNLDDLHLIPAAHLSLLFNKSLCQSNRPYKWMFLETSGEDTNGTKLRIKNAIISTCDRMIEDLSTSPEKLAECIACKQVLTSQTCQEIVTELLSKRIELLERLLQSKETSKEFVEGVATTLNSVYIMFIDGQSYNSAAKEMRRPKVYVSSFGIKYVPKVVEQFNKESINVEDTPRVGQLAQLLLSAYVNPLKTLLDQAFLQRQYLVSQKSFKELNDYQNNTKGVLKEKTDDLMRIVLGTSKSLWMEAFYPIFQQKSEQVVDTKVCSIFNFLDQEAFPNYKKLDDGFDLVTYIWKTSISKNLGSPTFSSSKDVDLKLKCISPHVADICAELEDRFVQFLKDFQTLGDFTLKKFISFKFLDEWKKFLERALANAPSMFLGRFVNAIIDLCPTLWKLMDAKDGTDLRVNFSSVSETCWNHWSTEVADKFASNLSSVMNTFQNENVAVFMPVAEEYIPEGGEESVKPSIRVPVQISHSLHSNLCAVCHDLSRAGPQSIPKKVRETFRQAVGTSIISLYKEVMNKSEASITPQIAIQLIFDIKFCQWFHLQLKDIADPMIKYLQNVIDPFDMDIVSPRLKANLKRFLFETHLTLGLLFSEESHSFIAQNFKTKMNMSFPTSNTSIISPLPLLPV